MDEGGSKMKKLFALLFLVSCSPKYKVGDCLELGFIQFKVLKTGNHSYVLKYLDANLTTIRPFDSVDNFYTQVDCFERI
jgi:hypothetical protein